MTINVDPPPSIVQATLEPAQAQAFHTLLQVTDENDGPITDLDGSAAVLRLTDHPEGLSWGITSDGAPVRWGPWAVALADIRERGDGSLESMEIRAGNPANIGTALWRLNRRFLDHYVRAYKVPSALLSDPTAALSWEGRIQGVNIQAGGMVIVVSDANLNAGRFPQEVVTQQCGRRYRGDGCEFTGDPGNAELGNCARTLDACKLRGAWAADNGLPVLWPRLFGGFLGLPPGGYSI